MSGGVVDVDVLTAPAGEEPKVAPKYEAGNRMWVEAKEGQAYRIKVTNKTDQPICATVSIDGQRVSCRVLYARGDLVVQDVVAEVITVGSSVREVRKDLVFAKPKLSEGEGEGTLDKQLAGRADKLGCITVEVNSAIKTVPRPCASSRVVGGFGSSSVGEKAAKKKGAFKATTALGSSERVVEVSRSATSSWQVGQLLESVELSYGSVAMLLILGVPAAHFMVKNQNAGPAEEVDLTEDDVKPAAKVKKPKDETAAASAVGSPALKRIKPDPGKKITLDFTS